MRVARVGATYDSENRRLVSRTMSRADARPLTLTLSPQAGRGKHARAFASLTIRTDQRFPERRLYFGSAFAMIFLTKAAASSKAVTASGKTRDICMNPCTTPS